MFYIDLYWEHIKNDFLSETTMPSLDIWYVATPHQGSHVYHWLIYGKHEKIFLTEIIRPRALIFGM